MSEQAPKMSRMEQLHANRAAAEEAEKEAERARLEQEQLDFENAIYGEEAGITDISDEAEQRISEADAYQAHLEKMSERPTVDYSDSSARRETLDFAGLNEEPTYAAEREQKVMDAALEAKFAADPKLRRLEGVSKEVHELREQLVNADNAEELGKKLENREDALAELLMAYTKSDDYDPALAQVFVDRTDMASLDEASKKAFDEENERRAFKATLAAPKSGKEQQSQAEQTSETEPAKIDGSIAEVDVDDEPAVDVETETEPAKPVDAAAALSPLQTGESAHYAEYTHTFEADPKSKSIANLGGGIERLRDAEAQAADAEQQADLAAREALTQQATAAAGETRPQDLTDAERERNAFLDQNANRFESNRFERFAEDPLGTMKSAFNRLRKGFSNAYAERKARRAAGSETQDDQERKRFPRLNKKMTALIGGIAIAAGAVGTTIALKGDSASSEHVDARPDKVATAPAVAGSTEKPELKKEATPPEFNKEARTIEDGEGWIKQLGDMGIKGAEVPAMLKKLLEVEDPEVRDWVYERVNAEGEIEPGIARPGNIPESVLKSIQQLR